MKFDKEVLVELAYCCDGDGFGDYEVVLDTHIGSIGWEEVRRQVFKFEGKYYETHYRLVMPESQESAPYEGEDDEIECKEVKRRIKPVVVYE